MQDTCLKQPQPYLGHNTNPCTEVILFELTKCCTSALSWIGSRVGFWIRDRRVSLFISDSVRSDMRTSQFLSKPFLGDGDIGLPEAAAAMFLPRPPVSEGREDRSWLEVLSSDRPMPLSPSQVWVCTRVIGGCRKGVGVGVGWSTTS